MSDASIIPCFSKDYFEARAKFLKAAAARGLEVDSRLNPNAKGPGGEELYSDIIRIGAEKPKKALLLMSATHGVEGYCGSGPQIGFLEQGYFTGLPDDTAVIMLHALNPYGFAHDRRVNEDNIDLNRNFLDWGNVDLPTSAYGDIAEHVLPQDWGGPAMEAANAALAQYRDTHGPAAFQAAISSGQYHHPDGVFYGGQGASWSNQMLSQMLRDYVGEADVLGVIDFHTGLGPYGYGELIGSGTPEEKALAKSWYGDQVTDPEGGTSTSAPLDGVNHTGISRTLPNTKVSFIAAEYGTRDLDVVLGSIRADNWLYHRGDVASEQGQEIKRVIRDAFYPEFDDWKEMVWDRAKELVGLAMKGMERM
ncbi:MAG: M14 family metallopeptidase [Pseudomonadota bacterium]